MTPAPEGANLPPQDLDAEEAVLGAMMINDQAVLTASEIISDPGEFYREAHGTVYRAILALLARSEPIDAVTVSDELERMGALEQVGGRGFIFGLSSSVTVAANVKSHAQIVRDLSLLRRVAAAGLEIAELGYGRQGDVRDILDRAESAIFDVAQSRTTSDIVPIGGLLGDEVERISAATEQRGLTGASSGLRDLDKITSGFQNSNLIILGTWVSVRACRLWSSASRCHAARSRSASSRPKPASTPPACARVTCATRTGCASRTPAIACLMPRSMSTTRPAST